MHAERGGGKIEFGYDYEWLINCSYAFPTH